MFLDLRKTLDTVMPAGGRGASVSACAGLTNQLLSCWVDPRIAWIKHSMHTDTAIVGDRWTGVGDTTPCTVNWCKKKVSSGVPDQLQNFVVINKFEP